MRIHSSFLLVNLWYVTLVRTRQIATIQHQILLTPTKIQFFNQLWHPHVGDSGQKGSLVLAAKELSHSGCLCGSQIATYVGYLAVLCSVYYKTVPS